jgi:hypothetical protein
MPLTIPYNDTYTLKLLARDSTTPLRIQKQLTQVTGWDTYSIRKDLAETTDNLDILLELAGDTSVIVRRAAKKKLKKLFESS